MRNDNKHVHINSSGRNILGNDAHSSVSKCIVDDMTFGVVDQYGWKAGLRKIHSLLIDKLN